MGVGPRRPALADARARARSSARCSSRRPAGSGRSGTRRTRRCSRSRRPRRPARGRVGRPLVVADHQRRAPRDARARRALRPLRVRHLRRAGPGALDALQRVSCGRWTSRSAASSTRRCSRRAAGSSPTSRSCASATSCSASSPAARTAWPTASCSRPAARGRLRAARRRDDRLDDDRALGAARARHPRGRHQRRRLARGLPVRHVPDDRDRLAARARVADLVRRRPRLGAVRPDRAGRAAVGHRSGRRASARRWSPRGIGVYGTTGRLEKCYRAYGAELESEYTVVEAGMERPKVKEQDFVGKEAHLRHREEEPAAVLCTLTVDDHASASGVEALPAGPRADHDARRRRRSWTQGPPLVRDERRRRAVGRQAHPAGLPAARARGRGLAELAVEYMGERYPVTVAVVGADAALRSGEHEDPLVNDPRLRQAGADDRRQDRPHRRRAGDRDAAPRVHDQPARGVRRRGGSAARRDARRRVGRAHARPARGRGAAARRDGARHRPRASTSSPAARSGTRRRPRRRSCDAIARNEAARRRLRPVFFGNEAADSGGYQVGIRVAHALGRPVATGLKGVTVDGGRVRCEQEVAGGRDVYDLPLPAVVTVLEGLNLPRYPSVPGRLRAQTQAGRVDLAGARAARASRRCGSSSRRAGQGGRDPRHGPEAAPRVVEVLQRDRGRVSVLVFVERGDGAGRRALAAGAHVRPRRSLPSASTRSP